MAPPLKVLICGGGIAGPSLALWLTRVGCSVTVVERSSQLRASGQQIDIRAQGVTVMRKMGIEAAIRAHLVDEPGTQLIDSTGKQMAYFAANKSGKGAQSITSELEIMRGDLCHILHDATKDKTKYVFGVHVTGFEQLDGTEGVRAHFSDGTEDTYDLLVGADGQNSEIRRLMLAQDGAEDQLVRNGMNYAWFSIPSQEGDTSLYTLYLSPRKRLTATRKDKPETLRIYFIASTRSLSDDHPLRQAHKSGSLEELKKAWVGHYRDAGWQLERFLQQIDSSEASDFYSCESFRVDLDTYSRGRVALVGDAATCASPIGGMGTAIALVGAYCFAGEIARHCKLSVDGRTDPTDEPRDGLAAALKAYEETYRPFVTKTQQFIPRLPDIFLPESSWGVWILTRIIWFAMTLKVDKLLSMLAPDVGGWDLPEYPELGTIQVK